MKYMGSKRRFAKHMLPIILKDRKPDQWYVEPFVGGANVIDKVKGLRRANDINHYLIAMYKALQDGWVPPRNVTEEMYNDVRAHKRNFPPELVGYIGFSLSYGGKWFGGYRRDSIGLRNYSLEAYNDVMKQVPLIKDIIFEEGDYSDMYIPPNSIIYCDPPYRSTTGYKNRFNHGRYWNWVRDMCKQGHQVFASEYEAPDDFKCVWSKETTNSLTKDTGAKKGIEKLFVWGNTCD